MGRYRRKDHFYNKAKAQGIRSRAYYKLKELQKKYRIIKPGYKVVDLGAWPGGWLQAAAKLVGLKGLVTGIDLVPIEDFEVPHIKVITGDVREDSSVQQMLKLAGEKYDVLLSDMSPKLTGIKEVDRVGAVGLAETALRVAEAVLKPGGSFVAKVFKGDETERFVKTTRPLFTKLVRAELASTRKSSNEYYLVGCGFKA